MVPELRYANSDRSWNIFYPPSFTLMPPALRYAGWQAARSTRKTATVEEQMRRLGGKRCRVKDGLRWVTDSSGRRLFFRLELRRAAADGENRYPGEPTQLTQVGKLSTSNAQRPTSNDWFVERWELNRPRRGVSGWEQVLDRRHPPRGDNRRPTERPSQGKTCCSRATNS
jgi:hypothetical protein